MQRVTTVLLLAGLAALTPDGASAGDRRLDGVNVIAVPGHPFGSATATASLAAVRALGARTVAIIPFFWQRDPASAEIVRGDDMRDDALRAGIRAARALGLAVMVKPHVWVPESWAGAVAPAGEDQWQSWFAGYGSALAGVATIAAEERADTLALGTELEKTSRRPEWRALIAETRGRFPGKLTYVAHNLPEAEAVPFWGDLDAVAVSLYPPLGADDHRSARRRIMQDTAARLDGLAARTGKTIIVAEVGLRSARGAAEKPWESAEERSALPAPALQAEVLGDWLAALDRPAVSTVLIWRWLTDPAAGGLQDTDFTVQGKPAEQVLRCAWTAVCVR